MESPAASWVDTHVIRLSQRLDLTRNDDPKKNRTGPDEGDPQGQVDQVSPTNSSGTAAASAPPANQKCAECNLESLCYSKDKTVL